MRHAFAMLVVLVVAGGTATATPSVLRAGANHHLGDDSFVAAFGREPTADDSEPLRMHVHLTYVRALLASREATRPELAARRTQLLGYLDDYIVKGTTPQNTYVPYRNPVFIDRDGTICAVGYLIERSVGRDVAEHIAATHRLDYLEDIAAAMPEVAAWVDGSGFTLDELASIQPGYPGPDVMHMGGWLADTGADRDWQDPVGAPMPKDGTYKLEADDTLTEGAFAAGKMTGAWTVKIDGKLRGKGTFVRGHGTWTSLRADGSKLAEGRFEDNRATGTWRFYHPSGRLAAKGSMSDGRRDGKWKFFYDNERSSKLSVGSFSHGETLGGWKHYDERGHLVAASNGRAWAGLGLEVTASKSGVSHAVHQGLPADDARLDGWFRGSERLYVDQNGNLYDGRAHALEQAPSGTWLRRACKWSKKRKAAAEHGDVNTLHAMLRKGDDGCDGKPVAVSKARGKAIDSLLAARVMDIHAPIPTFDIDPTPPPAPDPADADADADDDADSSTTEPERSPRGNPADFATYLAETMTWYVEWPHVDNSFRAVYATLPGYTAPPQKFD